MSDEARPQIDFVTDAELIGRLNLPEKVGRTALLQFSHDANFPKKDQLFGGRRFWPAVVTYLYFRYGLTMSPPSAPDGVENWNANSRRTRSELARS